MENKNKPIGIFDSGVGGLTVVNHLLEVLPKENFIFFADSANVPYGNKDTDTLRKLVLDDIDFICSFDIKALIVACNTADSVIDKKIRDLVPVDIIGPIVSTARLASQKTKNKRIGVMATEATCNSQSYIKALSRYDKTTEIYQQPCPLLASYIEDQDCFSNEQVMTDLLKQYLTPLLEKEVDTIILGCTHYPLALKYLTALAPSINFVSSSLAIALETEKLLKKNGLIADKVQTREIYTSGKVKEFKKKTNLFITKNIRKTIKKAY
ncbi:MAG TPA: glutamate racemase [Erysipelotrichaceae bacterium]|nr:glutamate racemase [Erysipelotrichaceae bacterium]